MVRFSCLAALLCPALAVAQNNIPPQPLPQNVLVIVADDLGIERVGAYGFRNSLGMPTAGPTPNLDALASRGVRFTNVWSNPTCSPTRATMMTGNYSMRTGIGRWINAYAGGMQHPGDCTIVNGGPQMQTGNAQPGLSTAFTAIPEILPPNYRNASLGKWHLGHLGLGGMIGGLNHIVDTGFEVYAGAYANFNGMNQDFFNWIKTFNVTGAPPSQVSLTNRYATLDTTDDVIQTIQAYGNEPWFLWVAYNTPHTPLHAPPDTTHTYNLQGDPNNSPEPHCEAMIQSLDTYLGRMFATIDPVVMARTTIIFLSDNGTATVAVEDPFDQSNVKGSLYNGGVNVPFIVAGAAVAASEEGEVCHALVNTTDIFATVAELTGATVPVGAGEDSVSFVPYLSDADTPSVRDYIYAEKFPNNFVPSGSPPPAACWDRAVRGPRYKLIVQPGSPEEFYDLGTQYLETMSNQLDIATLSGATLAEYIRLKRILANL